MHQKRRRGLKRCNIAATLQQHCCNIAAALLQHCCNIASVGNSTYIASYWLLPVSGATGPNDTRPTPIWGTRHFDCVSCGNQLPAISFTSKAWASTSATVVLLCLEASPHTVVFMVFMWDLAKTFRVCLRNGSPSSGPHHDVCGPPRVPLVAATPFRLWSDAGPPGSNSVEFAPIDGKMSAKP